MIQTLWTPADDGILAGARYDGKSGPPIVFVHGVGSSAAIWDYQLEALSARHRCYAIELRGNGSAQTEPPPATVTREGFVEDVLAVAKTVSIERFHFVGCSLGGVVGFELMRRMPERIASLTLVGSFAAYPNADQQVATIIAGVTEAGSLEAFAQARIQKILPPNSPQRRIDETIAQMAQKSLPSYIASTKATWTGDYRADLPAIDVPTLVMCGELDPIAPVALSHEIASGIPGALLTVIPHAGHVTNADAPRAFNDALVQILVSVEKAGRAVRH
ncbi:MAG: alpha/beta fold hydrolase [Candidatus Eremiobacteraeota bacterium]|nr:alpha/beta fold hydrolase [Candidatus Eremiobacteraeota bacterium]